MLKALSLEYSPAYSDFFFPCLTVRCNFLLCLQTALRLTGYILKN